MPLSRCLQKVQSCVTVTVIRLHRIRNLISIVASQLEIFVLHSEGVDAIQFEFKYFQLALLYYAIYIAKL